MFGKCMIAFNFTWMARRATRRAELLDANAPAARRARRVPRRDPHQPALLQPGCETYRLGTALLRFIDDLAGKLTGDAEFFWTKPHSTADRMVGGGAADGGSTPARRR